MPKERVRRTPEIDFLLAESVGATPEGREQADECERQEELTARVFHVGRSGGLARL